MWSSILAWRIPWTEEPGGYSPWGDRESRFCRHPLPQLRPHPPQLTMGSWSPHSPLMLSPRLGLRRPWRGCRWDAGAEKGRGLGAAESFFSKAKVQEDKGDQPWVFFGRNDATKSQSKWLLSGD